MPKNYGVFIVQFHNTNLALTHRNGHFYRQNGQQKCFNCQHVAQYLLPKKLAFLHQKNAGVRAFMKLTQGPGPGVSFCRIKYIKSSYLKVFFVNQNYSN